ncbi:sodium/pantothenate symporter (panF) [Rickettsia prowazekii str. GvV257]|uniref:sodium:solute symporter family protein n=1 Tax=Rickettsia prowazekii TaxID=782 RepID=UPI000256C235|nr:sodium:solute symporter family protein [Rickettsia prowazekii]AFE52995.1 sodium/pantothenate symporter (panF) [Rickettsia prowazekii str. GvV257]AFE53567.1 sodium/pantothenate symporter (panF) [Rickettsia prowazekii str. RpGvF24]EOB09946.1 Sodium/pantothenate symporter [Rickettsia prowazekii str. GvF12]
MFNLPIYNIIVFIYLISILVIGIYYRAKHSSFKHYANVERKSQHNKLLLIATIFTSSVGGATTFGIMEKVFLGHGYYAYALIVTIPIDILIAFYMVPLIAKHYGAESIGDIMSRYYGNTGRFIGGISTVIVSVGFLAAQISVSGYIFKYILGIHYVNGVVLSYSIVLIYTTIGGLQSIIFTNLLQFFAMIIAIPTITFISLNKIGVVYFIDNFTNTNFDQNNRLYYTITAALNFSVMNLYPTFIQRALINKNPTHTTKAIYVKSAIYFFFLICITLNGLTAFKLYPNQPSNLVLPYLINQIIPPVMQGFVISGLLAAVMSTADSDLNVTSISIVKDIINPIVKVKNQKKLLLIVRIINVIIGSFAIIVALKFSNVIDLVMFFTGFWGPVILVPLITTLFDIRTSKIIIVLSSFSGATTFLTWEYYSFSLQYFNLRGVFVGTIMSLVIFILGQIIISRKLLK